MQPLTIRTEKITFPQYAGLKKCLMMPYIQGRPESVPADLRGYADVIERMAIEPGEVGYLTIHESEVPKGIAQRASRAKGDRALHTEAGINEETRAHPLYCWGGGWAGRISVMLEKDTRILVSSNTADTTRLWNATHHDTSSDGDLCDFLADYPYEDSIALDAGEVAEFGILTPHESVPVKEDTKRQFVRVLGRGVHGREPYFTKNPLGIEGEK